MIQTRRLLLRPWREADREDFAAMNADPEVMRDLGGPITRGESDAKLDRYAQAFDREGVSRWVIENRLGGEFMGYAGVLHRSLPALGAHLDLGWRLKRSAWGCGYATEAAGAALRDIFARFGPVEVLACAAADNFRSQAVMGRLELERDARRDFVARDDRTGEWRGLVWVARPTGRSPPIPGCSTKMGGDSFAAQLSRRSVS